MTTLRSLPRTRATRSSRRHPAAGFTLTEILIAIALIVLIVGIAVANLSNTLSNSQESVAKLFVTEGVDTPLLTYKLQIGNYPTTEQGLRALIQPPEGVTGWKTPFLNTPDVPLDPWKNPYQYMYPGAHNGTAKYDVWSMGPDGANGTADDIGNW